MVYNWTSSRTLCTMIVHCSYVLCTTADTVARQTMHLTGATERDIDIIFGWNEALYHAIMQLHYESNLQREKRSMVTSMI